MGVRAALTSGALATSLWLLSCDGGHEIPSRRAPTSGADVAQKHDTQADLVKAVGALPVWQMGPDDFTRDEWASYVLVADRLQKTAPDVVASVLAHFALKPDEGYDLFSRPDSRALVVLRVMFDLPEHANQEQRECNRFLGGWKRANNGNLSWPVKWAREPHIRPYTGFMGGPYDPAGEYRCFLRHFRFRDFSAFNRLATRPAP